MHNGIVMGGNSSVISFPLCSGSRVKVPFNGACGSLLLKIAALPHAH